jgi:glycosyltransferase involved in cell wall biosynthesis
MSAPTVSVVMAVRNGAGRLAEAIRSIQQQTASVHEIVLVDGRSTDDTTAIARRHNVRVVDQVGPTLADAYNTGVRETSGSHVAYLSYDDVWTPHKLELQLALLAADARLDAAVGMARFVVEPGDEIPPGFRPELLERPIRARIMETLLTPRWVYERVGPHRAAASPADDTDWYARADDAGIRFGAADEVVLIKRVHAASNAHTSPNQNAGLMETVRAALQRKREAAND